MMKLSIFGMGHVGEGGRVFTMCIPLSRARDAQGVRCNFNIQVWLPRRKKPIMKYAAGLENAMKLHETMVDKLNRGEPIK